MHADLKHTASRAFWLHYRRLPQAVRELADKNFQLLKVDPKHPSLHFKRIGDYWSVRVGLDYRALATIVEDGVAWFWIGSHREYERLLVDR